MAWEPPAGTYTENDGEHSGWSPPEGSYTETGSPVPVKQNTAADTTPETDQALADFESMVKRTPPSYFPSEHRGFFSNIAHSLPEAIYETGKEMIKSEVQKPPLERALQIASPEYDPVEMYKRMMSINQALYDYDKNKDPEKAARIASPEYREFQQAREAPAFSQQWWQNVVPLGLTALQYAPVGLSAFRLLRGIKAPEVPIGEAPVGEAPAPAPPGTTTPPVPEAGKPPPVPAAAAEAPAAEAKPPPVPGAPVEPDAHAEMRLRAAQERFGVYGIDPDPIITKAHEEAKGQMTFGDAADVLAAEEAKIPEADRIASLNYRKTLQELRIQRELEASTRPIPGVEPEEEDGRSLTAPMRFNVTAEPGGGFRVEVPPRTQMVEIPPPEGKGKATIDERTIPGGTFFLPEEGGELQPYASRKRGAAEVPQRQVRPQVGKETPLRPEGKTPGTRSQPVSPTPRARPPVEGTAPETPHGMTPEERYVVRETDHGAVVKDMQTGENIYDFTTKSLHPKPEELAELRQKANNQRDDLIKELTKEVRDKAEEEVSRQGREREPVPIPKIRTTTTDPGTSTEPFSTKTNFQRVSQGNQPLRYEHKETGLIIQRNKEAGGWDVRHPKTGEVVEHGLPDRETAMRRYASGHVPEKPPPVPETVPLGDKEMVDTATRTFFERGSPAHKMSRNQMIAAGRHAIEEGVDPQRAYESTVMPADEKYAIVRAQAENLRDASHEADVAFRKSKTPEARDAANRAFWNYVDWDKKLDVARKNASEKFPDIEPEVQFDPRTYTDMRLQKIKMTQKDFTPKQAAQAERDLADIRKKTAARNDKWQPLDEELRKQAPDVKELKDEKELREYTDDLFNDKPCS